jgi:hypothetical protein
MVALLFDPESPGRDREDAQHRVEMAGLGYAKGQVT